MVAEEAAASGVHVTVLAPPSRNRELARLHDSSIPGMTVIRTAGIGRVGAIWRLRRTQFDHVVISSFWSPMSLVYEILRIIRILRTPDLVLTPRGQLNAGPLLTSRWKKVVALPAYRFIAQSSVDRFVATSPSEQDAIETILKRKAILSRQTTTALEVTLDSPSGAGALNVGFVSRIHPRKGLLETLRGLSLVQAEIKFTIAGDVQDATYWRSCQQLTRDFAANVDANYVGLLGRAEVEGLFRDLDVLVLVSSGENFGHAIAEALQVGVRVVICPDTPWSHAVSAQPLAGAVLPYPLNAEDFAVLIDTWAMSERADRRHWRAAARQMYTDSQTQGAPTVTEVILSQSGGAAL
jgi:glycosyltransferase involved in cell wall biosynthesis